MFCVLLQGSAQRNFHQGQINTYDFLPTHTHTHAHKTVYLFGRLNDDGVCPLVILNGIKYTCCPFSKQYSEANTKINTFTIWLLLFGLCMSMCVRLLNGRNCCDGRIPNISNIIKPVCSFNQYTPKKYSDGAGH